MSRTEVLSLISNKLLPQTVHSTTVVKTSLQRKHAKLGLTSGRYKRSFGIDDLSLTPQPAPDPPPSLDDEVTPEFEEISRQLIDDATEALQELANSAPASNVHVPEASPFAQSFLTRPAFTGDVPGSAAHSRPHLPTSSDHKTCISLANLFI